MSDKPTIALPDQMGPTEPIARWYTLTRTREGHAATITEHAGESAALVALREGLARKGVVSAEAGWFVPMIELLEGRVAPVEPAPIDDDLADACAEWYARVMRVKRDAVRRHPGVTRGIVSCATLVRFWCPPTPEAVTALLKLYETLLFVAHASELARVPQDGHDLWPARYFRSAHLPDGGMRWSASIFGVAADRVVRSRMHRDEAEHALRGLLEAKDAAVRAMMEREQ